MVRVADLAGWGLLCGLGLGLGLWSLASLVPRLSRPRLANRVAPYLIDFSPGARELLRRRTVDPLPVIGALVAPLVGRLVTLLGRVLGGAPTIELRLRQSASALTLEQFRSRQLVWGVFGLAAGVLASLMVGRTQTTSIPLQLGIVVVFGVAALSLSAGEGILDALRRVGRVSQGELASELSGVVGEVSAGRPLAEALDALAAGVRLPALTRGVEQITGALERGSPLAEVLRAQAQDARDEAKRGLLELAGKKEVAMLVPLVFLILPVTVVFAIFPGIAVLQMGL
jgi:tight adherence protein C